jgi:hypothetical protein
MTFLLGTTIHVRDNDQTSERILYKLIRRHCHSQLQSNDAIRGRVF